MKDSGKGGHTEGSFTGRKDRYITSLDAGKGKKRNELQYPTFSKFGKNNWKKTFFFSKFVSYTKKRNMCNRSNSEMYST